MRARAKMARAFAAGLLGLATCSLDTGDDSMAEKAPYALSRECNFDSISDEYFSNDCSPRITDPAFTGLVINVPVTVELSAAPLRVPLACTFSHRLSEARNSHLPIENAITFVAVDMKSHEVFSGRVPGMENPIPPPPPPPGSGAPAEEAGDFEVVDKIVRGYVNLDLVKTIGLPQKPAEYTVYATFDDHKSNVLDLRVTRGE